jgi:hypothetical protein
MDVAATQKGNVVIIKLNKPYQPVYTNLVSEEYLRNIIFILLARLHTGPQDYVNIEVCLSKCRRVLDRLSTERSATLSFFVVQHTLAVRGGYVLESP